MSYINDNSDAKPTERNRNRPNKLTSVSTMKDSRGVERGQCNKCGHCSEYQPPLLVEPESGYKCTVCRCPPGRHVNLYNSKTVETTQSASQMALDDVTVASFPGPDEAGSTVASCTGDLVTHSSTELLDVVTTLDDLTTTIYSITTLFCAWLWQPS